LVTVARHGLQIRAIGLTTKVMKTRYFLLIFYPLPAN